MTKQNNSNKLDEQRQNFEDWWSAENKIKDEERFAMLERSQFTGRYFSIEQEAAWKTWQHLTILQDDEVAVPREQLTEMISLIRRVPTYVFKESDWVRESSWICEFCRKPKGEAHRDFCYMGLAEAVLKAAEADNGRE